MNDILTHYQHEAKRHRSPIAWLADIQQRGLDTFLAQGFPNRHHEEWKYTRLDGFLKQPYGLATAEASSFTSTLPQWSECERIDIVNGDVILPSTLHLPKGAFIKPLAEAVVENEALIRPYLAEVMAHEHAFLSLNTAMLQTGVVIYVPEGVHLPKPIVLAHAQTQDGQSVHVRHVVIAKPHSALCLIETYEGQTDADYFTNVACEVLVQAHACVTHIKLQEESTNAYHIGHTATCVEEKGQYHHHSLSFGGKCVRSDLNIRLLQPMAQTTMNGMYLPGFKQHVDHHTTVHHEVSSCTSEQEYRGILSQQSRAVFNGKVIVSPHAQHTVAHQQNKNLMLADDAEIDTKPQLEIFADDVVCTHGATIGQLDSEALFYLASRGIDAMEAKRYLVQGFLSETVQKIPYAPIVKWASLRINQVLR